MTRARRRCLTFGATAVLATAVLAAGVAGPAAAQGVAPDATRTGAGAIAVVPAPSARLRPDPLARDGDAASSTRADREEATVIARGTPRSFQIVSVPVPAEFQRDATVSFEVLATGIAPLLGARQGVLEPAEGTAARALAMTVGIPARAPAGRQRVAQVRFAANGRADIITPVDVDVAPVRRMDALVTPALVAGRAGGSVEIRYRLTNLGNAPDSVRVHVESVDPSPLRPVDSDVIVVAMNNARDLVLHLSLPRTMPPSVVAIELRVVGLDGDERATAQASVEIVAAARGPGGMTPVLTTSLAAPLGMGGTGAPALAFALQGPVATDMRVEGRYTRLGTDEPMAVTALTRLGYYDVPPMLAVATSNWRVAGGGSGARLTDLTGGSAWGVGAAGALDVPDWRGAAVIAHPGLSRNDPTRGVLAGATASHLVGASWVTGSISHMLEDQEAFARRLDAISVGAETPVAFDATLDAELAARKWRDGNGLGARINLDRRTARDNAMVRLLHAPGGSAAFAPSRDELSANMSRVIDRRWIVGASGWLNTDAGVLDRGMRSSGWALQPQLAVSELTSVALRVRASAFEMRGLASDISTAEKEIGAVLNTRRNTLYGSGSFGIGTRDRSSASRLAAASYAERVTRSTTEATGGWTSALGTVELSASVERNLAGMGLTPDRSILGMRVDRLAVVPSWTSVYLSGSVQRTGWLGERQRATLAQMALTGDVRYGLRATLGVQHNSFFAPGAGRWTTVIGVDRAIGLPRPQRRRTGTVYEDLNGNGMRDEGEPGFAGAVIRAGGSTVATSGDGRFRLPPSARPVVDSRSLPVGWLPGPSTAQGATQWSDLAVIPTSVVEIALVPAASGDGRLPRADLTAADVMARDAGGRVWMARVTPGSVAVFDALPPGDYRVEVDLSRLKEPLTTRAGLPTFSVQAAPTRRRFTVEVMPRPLKMWRPNPQPASDAPKAAVPGVQ